MEWAVNMHTFIPHDCGLFYVIIILGYNIYISDYQFVTNFYNLKLFFLLCGECLCLVIVSHLKGAFNRLMFLEDIK